MSELKDRWFWAYPTESVDCDGITGSAHEVYSKSEVDEVIADLKEKHKTEIKELLCLIRDKENNFNRAFDSEEKEIRHHKYKRCLAMAWWCNERHTFNETNEKRTWLHKWHNRWLELAEIFKEAK